MSRILIITILTFLISLPASAQHAEKELNQIRGWFKEVNAHISQYRKEEHADIKISQEMGAEHYAMEGERIYRLEKVHLTRFFDKKQLMKIVVAFYGDREDLISEYYFHESDLFFVDKVRTVYHQPKWADNFEETERSVVKNRFYFKDEQLIRWVNPEIHPVGKMDPSYDDHEEEIVHDYKLYISME